MPDKTPTTVRRRRIAGERSRTSTRPGGCRPRPPKPPRPARVGAAWRPGPRTLAWFVPLCVLALAAAALAGWLGYREHRGSQIEAAREDAVAPAGQAAEALLSFRYDTLQSELESERDLLADSYAEKFLNVFPGQARQITSQQQATVESTVLAAGPLECGADCSPDEVDVLVYLNVESAVQGQAPEVKANRAVVRMTQQDGEWRVGGIDLF